MKYLTFILIFLFSAITSLSAEYNITDSLNETLGVTIIQPDQLRLRLEKASPKELSPEEQEELTRLNAAKNITYSVEVFADNSRQAEAQANARRHSIEQRFPHLSSVLEYQPPFWRVKVGHFSNRSDAEETLAEIKKVFPSYAPYLRVVRNSN